MAGGRGTAEISKKYPNTDGLTENTKHEGKDSKLQPQEKSLISHWGGI